MGKHPADTPGEATTLMKWYARCSQYMNYTAIFSQHWIVTLGIASLSRWTQARISRSLCSTARTVICAERELFPP